MKVVIQRSGHSKVLVNQEIVGEIRSGLVLLICFEKKDLIRNKKEILDKAKQKILALRIFEDYEGKMNKSIIDIGGEILAISQFTLSWDGQKGNRPSFDESMPPQDAKAYFDEFVQMLRESRIVQTGVFGASMDVQIQNLGPVTFSLDF